MDEFTILIVDDEPANVRLLERILAKANYTNILTTQDSRRALAIVAERAPGLILLDLHMPQMDGFAVLERLREMVPPDCFLPVLVLTADITSQAKLRALAAGAHDFLTKPFDKSEVILRVGNLRKMRELHMEVQAQNARLEEKVNQRTAELQTALHRLESTQKQVVQQERLRALGLMASGVAHDFNNALSVILGFSEILMLDIEKIPGGEEYSKHLKTVITAALDGAEMVTRLRDFYRPASATPEPRVSVDLNELATQALTLTQPRWKAQALYEKRVIAFETELGEVPLIAGDPAELREALTNLIFNAVDAMPDGGTITVRTAAAPAEVVLEVRDSGVGMSEEVRQRCLEPFFTTKGENGTGLGLAMVYGIVERHQGTVEIDSTPGVGTTFRLRIPQGEVAVTAEGGSAHMERLLNILVADDQPVLCEILTEYLQHDWHTVTTAHSGQEALARLAERPFDLLISDRAMPRMAGDELATAARALYPGMKIILLTGFVDEDAPTPPNVDLVLPKPVTLLDLRRAIVRVSAPKA